MKTRQKIPALCLLGALVALPLFAADPPAGFGQRISLDLVDAKPADVFASFGEIVGREVVVDPAVTAPITIRLQKVTAGTALQAICESIECRWRFEAGKLAIRPRPSEGSAGPGAAKAAPKTPEGDAGAQPISLSLRGARLEEVLNSFGKVLGVEIEVAPEVADAPISIELQNVPAREAFDAVLDLANAEAVEVSAEPRRLAVRQRG